MKISLNKPIIFVLWVALISACNEKQKESPAPYSFSSGSMRFFTKIVRSSGVNELFHGQTQNGIPCGSWLFINKYGVLIQHRKFKSCNYDQIPEDSLNYVEHTNTENGSELFIDYIQNGKVDSVFFPGMRQTIYSGGIEMERDTDYQKIYPIQWDSLIATHNW